MKRPAGARTQRGSGPRLTRVGRGLSSWIAGLMLIGTLGYVVRDNFRVGAAVRGAEVEVLCGEARECLARGEVAEALEWTRRALEADPQHLPALACRIEALAAAGELGAARLALEELERGHPDSETVRVLVRRLEPTPPDPDR